MAVDFSGPAVESIEEALQAERPGGWQRLSAAALHRLPVLSLRAGWAVSVPKGQFAASVVDRLLVLIDATFPASDLRIVAPDLQVGDWPHVESGGLLCLRGTARAAPAGDRVRRALADATEVLNMDEAARAAEFEREFVAYWEHSRSDVSPLLVTLMTPHPGETELWFARLPKRDFIVLSDNEASLRRWLENAGELSTMSLRRTRLRWLKRPWQPSEFPRRVSDVSDVFGAGFASYLHRQESLPVIFGATTPTGDVFVGVDVPALPRKHLAKGFRPNANVPPAMLAALSAGHKVRLCRVERGDSAWVHGRGHDPQQAVLAQKQVAVIGCGALGGSIARLLAQMGVGALILADSDKLSSANTSRHVLGAPLVGKNKAIALAHRLRRDFPDVVSIEPFDARFENLSEAQLARIAECDLVVSAGVDWTGDLALDQWRRSLIVPPIHLCTWAEEFALAGHAVALFGGDSIVPAFSSDGLPHIRLTDWPESVKTKIVEAGCGNDFQPHGVVDLADCTTLAAKLAIDVLCAATTASGRRAWLGDRDAVLKLGGEPRPDFDISNTRKEFPWPPGPA